MENNDRFNALCQSLTQEVLKIMFVLKFIEKGTISDIGKISQLIIENLDENDQKLTLKEEVLVEIGAELLVYLETFPKNSIEILQIREAIEVVNLLSKNTNSEEFMEKETQIRGEIKMRILVYFCIIFLSEKILFSELINSRELIDLIIQQKITNDYLIDDEFEDFFEDLDKENLHAIINKEVITAIAQHGFIFYINFRSKEKKYSPESKNFPNFFMN